MSTDPSNGYWIQDPDNVVEASFSAEPDDVSIASIRILVNPETPATVHHLEIEVEVYAPTEGDDTIPENTLTRNPRSITPQALDHGDWEMTTNGNGVFTATARQPLALQTGRSGWVLYLRDVDVINRIGTTNITVREYRGDGTSAPTFTATLPVRKIQPKLRIDHFHIIDKDSLPLSHATTSGVDNVQLSWATTGATKVTLYGPAGAINLGTGDDAHYLDHTPFTSVDTTSTFTLVAEGAGGHVVEQLTVTITNQTKVANLVVEGTISGGPGADDPVEFADSVTMKKTLQVDGTISGGPRADDPVEFADNVTMKKALQVDGTISGGPNAGDPVEFADNVTMKKGLRVDGDISVKGSTLTISTGPDGLARLVIGDWVIASLSGGNLIIANHPERAQSKWFQFVPGNYAGLPRAKPILDTPGRHDPKSENDWVPSELPHPLGRQGG